MLPRTLQILTLVRSPPKSFLLHSRRPSSHFNQAHATLQFRRLRFQSSSVPNVWMVTSSNHPSSVQPPPWVTSAGIPVTSSQSSQPIFIGQTSVPSATPVYFPPPGCSISNQSGSYSNQSGSYYWLNSNIISPCYLINSRSLKNKVNDLHNFLYSNNPRIALFTESWLNDDISDAILDPENNYFVFRSDRKGRNGGGVCAFISRSMKCYRVALSDSRPAQLVWGHFIAI